MYILRSIGISDKPFVAHVKFVIGINNKHLPVSSFRDPCFELGLNSPRLFILFRNSSRPIQYSQIYPVRISEPDI